MDNNDLAPILIARATEQMRQEREVFEQRKIQEARWFYLRLVMGYSSVVLLASVLAICGYILIHSATFPTAVVTSAGAALFADILGLLISVWKIVINPSSITKLAPETGTKLPDFEVLVKAMSKNTKPVTVEHQPQVGGQTTKPPSDSSV